MAAPDIPLKFIKSMTPSGSLSTAEAGRFFIKLLYEFWGFCVNGTDSLSVPGGFASVSGVLGPTGFENGVGVLWAQGYDGKTTFATDVFHSDLVNFSTLDTAGNSRGNLIGKYLVLWKQRDDVTGDESTDDSVYPIIGLVDDNTIRVQVDVGGTRRVGNKAFFRDREGINFRVVDILATTKLSDWTDGCGLVLQFNRASDVNEDQASSQVKLSLRQSQQTVAIIVSPSGSWTGTTFTDGTTEISGSSYWFTHANAYNSWLLIAGRDALIVNTVPVSAAVSSGLHVEIPKRLYTGSIDPNPVAFNIWSQQTVSQLVSTYSNIKMVGTDNNIHPMVTQVRSPWGFHVDTAVLPVSGGLLQGFSNTTQSGRYANMAYNPYNDTFVTSDAVLGCNTPGQFCLSRVRLRRVRFTVNQFYNRFRFGDPGWIHVANGVLWPWDNSQQPLGVQLGSP